MYLKPLPDDYTDYTKFRGLEMGVYSGNRLTIWLTCQSNDIYINFGDM